jgi:diguanylate cyclase (GGDEF)-like protein
VRQGLPVAARTTTNGASGAGSESSAGQVAREVSALQAALLAKLRKEVGVDADPFAEAAQKLAEEFGSVAATAVSAVAAPPAAASAPEGLGLAGPGQMRRRLDQLVEAYKRYGHPFGLVVFDVDGPGVRGDGSEESKETVLTVLGAALRESVRLVDESFPLERDGVCVLAPNQTTVQGVQMTERLLALLDELEAAGGLRIGISAGVVACPEHGEDAEELLQKADEAMWRARALGQPVGVGTLPER